MTHFATLCLERQSTKAQSTSHMSELSWTDYGQAVTSSIIGTQSWNSHTDTHTNTAELRHAAGHAAHNQNTFGRRAHTETPNAACKSALWSAESTSAKTGCSWAAGKATASLSGIHLTSKCSSFASGWNPTEAPLATVARNTVCSFNPCFPFLQLPATITCVMHHHLVPLRKHALQWTTDPQL